VDAGRTGAGALGVKNTTDKWAPKLVAKLLAPSKFGRTATVTRWEGGTTSLGEPVGGSEVSYSFDISPPFPNLRKFSSTDVIIEGSSVCYTPQIGLPVPLTPGVVLDITYEPTPGVIETSQFTIVTVERIASGFETAAWKLTGNQ
jgi:hypothetical protein